MPYFRMATHKAYNREGAVGCYNLREFTEAIVEVCASYLFIEACASDTILGQEELGTYYLW